MGKKITITIDGPAGAGKSTVSKNLAEQLEYVYVDTGALYRGVALEVKRADIDYNDEEKLLKLLNEIDIDCKMENSTFKLLSNGIDISGEIRTPEISMLASAVSALPEVRSALLGIQKDISVKHNSIFEGRDMGTVVFPDADFKFFMIADLKIRAERRYKELAPVKEDKALGNSDIYLKIHDDIKKRDHDDSTRKESPLKPAEDAIIIDSTDLNIMQVVEKIRKNIIIT